MELQLNIRKDQIMHLISQMPVQEWEKLKKQVDLQLSQKNQNTTSVEREFGCLKGLVVYMADDFNAPLDDFKDYMPK